VRHLPEYEGRRRGALQPSPLEGDYRLGEEGQLPASSEVSVVHASVTQSHVSAKKQRVPPPGPATHAGAPTGGGYPAPGRSASADYSGSVVERIRCAGVGSRSGAVRGRTWATYPDAVRGRGDVRTLPSSHLDLLRGVVPHVMVVRLTGSGPLLSCRAWGTGGQSAFHVLRKQVHV
jgi:hypothetical protein